MAQQLRSNSHAVDLTAGAGVIGGSVNVQWDNSGTWIVSVTGPGLGDT